MPTPPEADSSSGSDSKNVETALTKEDPILLSHSASADDLLKLKTAEEVFELRNGRKKRSSRAALLAQAMVGYVALAGFFANAYQNYNNKKDAEARAEQETKRWEKEFDRAQDADKYRAFFETSALATDPVNPDKRLVGYALLKEFVSDEKYNSKATFMLEESLALELRSDTSAHGLDDQHRMAIVAILSALSQTSDCKALAQAARSVDRLVQHGHAPTKSFLGKLVAKPAAADDDIEEMGEVYQLYVRRLIGRAAEACANVKDFREVRKPIRALLMNVPSIGGLVGKPDVADANRRIAEILKTNCDDEQQSTALGDCTDVAKGYARLCGGIAKLPDAKDEEAGCAVMR